MMMGAVEPLSRAYHKNCRNVDILRNPPVMPRNNAPHTVPVSPSAYYYRHICHKVHVFSVNDGLVVRPTSL